MTSPLRIFTPIGLDGYELCQPANQGDFETIYEKISGRPQRATWSPISMRLIHTDGGIELARSDSPWLGAHALIFRAAVSKSLKVRLEDWGELLPLACQEVELSIYNPALLSAAALDEGCSAITRFKDGKIMMIHRHVFRRDVIAGVDIFKIKNIRVSPTFVSHRFVEAWETSGLTGLEFKQVWSDR